MNYISHTFYFFLDQKIITDPERSGESPGLTLFILSTVQPEKRKAFPKGLNEALRVNEVPNSHYFTILGTEAFIAIPRFTYAKGT